MFTNDDCDDDELDVGVVVSIVVLPQPLQHLLLRSAVNEKVSLTTLDGRSVVVIVGFIIVLLLLLALAFILLL